MIISKKKLNKVLNELNVQINTLHNVVLENTKNIETLLAIINESYVIWHTELPKKSGYVIGHYEYKVNGKLLSGSDKIWFDVTTNSFSGYPDNYIKAWTNVPELKSNIL